MERERGGTWQSLAFALIELGPYIAKASDALEQRMGTAKLGIMLIFILPGISCRIGTTRHPGTFFWGFSVSVQVYGLWPNYSKFKVYLYTKTISQLKKIRKISEGFKFLYCPGMTQDICTHGICHRLYTN